MEKAYDSYRVDKVGVVIGKVGGLPDAEIGPLASIMNEYFSLRRRVNTGELVSKHPNDCRGCPDCRGA